MLTVIFMRLPDLKMAFPDKSDMTKWFTKFELLINFHS